MNAKSLRTRHALFLCAFFFGIVGEILADGAVGYKGLRINVNGTQTWYNVHGVSWSYQGCGNFGSTFYNSGSSNWSSMNLGTFSSNSTFQITGYAVVGWVNNGDYLAGRLEYKIWKNGESEPVSWSLLNIGNYQSPSSGASQVVCTSNNDRIVGYDNGTTNIMPTSVGTYNFKVRALGRIQYTGGGGGSFNSNDGAEMTATFEVYDPYTIADGDWNTSSIWHNGSLPSSNIPVVINHNITINSSVTNAPSSVTINSAKSITFGASGALTATTVTNNGSIVMTSGGTLTIAAGGTLTNNATFTGGSGTISFAGAGTVNGSNAITFNNLTINAGTLTLTTVPTIDGTLRINNGNLSTAPRYSSNSTLLYNTTYSRFNEWNATGIGTIGTTLGYPNHVTINSGTFTVLNADVGTPRALNGTLTIASGATFATGALNALITVGGDIVNNGTIQMSTTNARIKCVNFNNASGASVTLSSTIGGDLEVSGDIVDNGTFNSNNRAIFFTGSNVQNISGSGTFNIDYIVSNKSGGSIKLLSNLLCEGPNGGNAMDLSTSNDIIDLNGYTLTLGKAGVASVLTGSGLFKGSSTSSISILGTGALGTINFEPSANQLNSLTFNRTSSGSATIGDNLIISGNLTITSGTLTLAASKQLTVSGTLTNNGTLTLESGATLVQGSNSTASTATGNGYVIRQLVSGSGSSTPNGRGWYIGTPVNGATSNVFTPSGSGNLLYHWNANQSTPNWSLISPGANSNLEVGKGYLIRMGSTTTLNFAANTLNNAPTSAPINIPCYRQSSSSFQGFNLVANPFPSYLDWNTVYSSNSSSFENKIWYRIAGANDVMVFDTYAEGVGTNVYGGAPVSNYIPPMQGYWVRLKSTVQAGSSATNLVITNTARSHYAGGAGAGLKSSAQDFPMFLRLNFLQDNKKDQVVLYMRPEASNDYDSYDAEKMFVSGYPQIYNQLASRKLVINGMKNAKKVTVIPLTLEVPSSGTYTLQAEEFNAEEGLILLEDKQEGIIQDLTFNDTYIFNASSGVLSNRFYIRFILPDVSLNSVGPSNQWVEEDLEINEVGSISIDSDGKGKITIQQDINPSGNGLMQLVDQSGKVVYTGSFSSELSTFELSGIQSGVYLVKVQLNGKEENKKIYIQL